MSKILATSKMIAVAFIAVALVFGSYFAVTTATAQAVTLSEMVELFISLGIIPADKADAARAALDSADTGSSTGGTGTSFTFTRNHSMGDSGGEVMEIQKFLNTDPDTRVAASGVGSPGSETSYFGSLTRAAVIDFQEKYASDVLAPVGLSAGTGYWGPSSRAKANAINASTGSGSGTGTGTGTTPTGTGITVASTNQPANGLFPSGAARVPFTRFTLTNNSGSPVTVNSVTVAKAGSISRAAFTDVVLLDGSMQSGDSRSLNSNDQATIGSAITIPAGGTKTLTVAGNRAVNKSGNEGETGGLSVIAINTSATVSGSLPITGAMHTVNSSLSVGTATIDRGAEDPNVDRNQEIGTTDYTFSSVRVEAGSNEDLRLHSVRWTNNGSADAGDLANLMVRVDGTDYPVTNVGDTYTAEFGNGIVIEEGFNKDVSIHGDVVSGNGDDVQFDIEEKHDIHVTGETFGYGILPTAGGGVPGSGSGFPASGNPFFEAATVTITGGSISTISKSNSAPAQNVAENVVNQPLGAFSTNLLGEGLEVDGIVFGIDTTGTGVATDLTNVTLVNENGSVVAGPVDGTTGNGNNGQIAFTDLIEFPTGSHTYTLRGKVGTNFVDGDTIVATTTVNTTYWTDPEGLVTGDAFTLPGNTVTMNTMTVKAGSLTINVGSTPAAQSIVAGVSDFTFANIIFDATGSGEDVRMSSVPLRATGTNMATSTDINGCQLFDGSNALNRGSNVVNGSDVNSGSDTTFTFNDSFTIPKGTTKSVAVRCNIAAGASGTFSWGINSGAAPTVTGVNSGQTLSDPITTTEAGQTMTIGSTGSLTVSVDASDPSESWYVAGEEATVGVFEFLSSNETFNLRDFELALNSASSSAADIAEIALFNGTTEIVRKVSPAFTSNDEVFEGISGFQVGKDDDENLAVKVKFAMVGPSQAGTSGSLVRFSTTTDSSDNEAQGVDSGSIVTLQGNVGTTNGARYFRSLPNVARESAATRTLLNSTNENLYEFSVTAVGDDVAVNQFTLNVATTAASVTNLDLIEVGSGRSVATVATVDSSTGTATFTFAGTGSDYSNAYLEIGEGETKTFRLEGDVTDGNASESTGRVTVKLNQDSAIPSEASGVMWQVSAISDQNFVWSPLSTTTNTGTNDWTNGYRVPGIKFGDLEGTTSSE